MVESLLGMHKALGSIHTKKINFKNCLILCFTLKIEFFQEWLHTLIPGLGKWRQKDLNFKVILKYTMSLKSVNYIICLKRKLWAKCGRAVTQITQKTKEKKLSYMLDVLNYMLNNKLCCLNLGYYGYDKTPWPNWEGKDLFGLHFHTTTVHHRRSQDRNSSRTEPEGRSCCKGHGEELLIGLLLVASSACFLVEPKTTNQPRSGTTHNRLGPRTSIIN